MKIALIGAGGFLGNAIVKGLYKADNKYEWHFFSSSNLLRQKLSLESGTFHFYKWPQHSLANEDYATVFLDADVIIYAAGAGIQPGENADERLIFNLNLWEPAKLVNRLIKQGFKGQLITFGSYFETGKNQPHQLLDEQLFLEQYNPLPNTYCRSKKELSHFQFVQQQTGIDFKWLHLVLTNIYGPGENESRLIPYIIRQSKNEQRLHFTSGSQMRQYTYIGDVVYIVGQLLGAASGLYHVTNEETIPVKMIIEETVQQVRNKLSVDPELYYDLAERRDTAMDYLAVSAQKLWNEWGLSCPTSFQEGISLYFDE